MARDTSVDLETDAIRGHGRTVAAWIIGAFVSLPVIVALFLAGVVVVGWVDDRVKARTEPIERRLERMDEKLDLLLSRGSP